MAKPGTVFEFDLHGDDSATARVLLDVYAQCIEPRRIAPDNPLATFSGSLLVEVCAPGATGASSGEPLIPGVFVDPGALDDGTWTQDGENPVDPTQVEFPEALIGFEGGALFRRGEVALPVDIDYEELERIEVFPTIVSSHGVAETCLQLLGSREPADPEEAGESGLEHADLRFSTWRPYLYDKLGLDEAEPYHHFAVRYGFDLRRFYD